MKSLLLILSFCLPHFLFSQTIEGIAKTGDGDGLTIKDQKIRLHGIDAPEYKQQCSKDGKIWDCGKQAADALRKMINNKKVFCTIKDKDRYQRSISVCMIDNTDINAWMVENGFAIAYRFYSYDYIFEEDEAKKKKIGIWSGDFIEPYKWRKGERLPQNKIEVTMIVKKSKSGICHDGSSRWYERTKNFVPYNSFADCLASGGRLPKK